MNSALKMKLADSFTENSILGLINYFFTIILIVSVCLFMPEWSASALASTENVPRGSAFNEHEISWIVPAVSRDKINRTKGKLYAEKAPVAAASRSRFEARTKITYADGKLSADLQGADIADVLTKIGQVVNARVEIGEGLTGKVTTSFQSFSLQDGLAKLISGEGAGIIVGYDQKGTVTFIKLSRKAGGQGAKVVAVKKVRAGFSQRDLEKSLSLDKVKEMMSIFRDRGKQDQWVLAAKQIMYIRIPEAKPYLKELIDHEDDFVRDEAVREYVRLVDAEDADFILDLAEDNKWQRRVAAASSAMPLVDDPRQIPILLKMLDEFDALREAAIGTLGVKRCQEAVPALNNLLKVGDAHTRAGAADALYLITGTKYDWMTPAERRDLALDSLAGGKIVIETGKYTPGERREAEIRLQQKKREFIERLHLTPEETREFEIQLEQREKYVFEMTGMRRTAIGVGGGGRCAT